MAKHLKEVWQTDDGKVFGSPEEAKEHEDRQMSYRAIHDALRDTMGMGQHVSPSGPNVFRNALARRGFSVVYTGDRL